MAADSRNFSLAVAHAVEAANVIGHNNTEVLELLLDAIIGLSGSDVEKGDPEEGDGEEQKQDASEPTNTTTPNKD